jgi:hypothetical protein
MYVYPKTMKYFRRMISIRNFLIYSFKLHSVVSLDLKSPSSAFFGSFSDLVPPPPPPLLFPRFFQHLRSTTAAVVLDALTIG